MPWTPDPAQLSPQPTVRLNERPGSSVFMHGSDSQPSLHPPPRRRAYTAGAVGPSTQSSSRFIDSGLTLGTDYSYNNGSTGDSLGMKPPQSLTDSSFSFSPTIPEESPRRSSDGVPRTSWSSSSSFTSGGDHSSSPERNAKRRSRHGTFAQHRLTPPNDNPSTGDSSSIASSPQGLFLDLRPLSPKRVSGSSVQSFVSTASASQSRSAGLFSQRPFSNHRLSVPPPQRPAPMSALPPTPSEGFLTPSPVTPTAVHSAPPAKSSFREALGLRSHRLSITPPSVPPSAPLPARPDESSYRTHKKSSSIGSITSPLYPIPASPTPTHDTPSPFPPPDGPLPPTPLTAAAIPPISATPPRPSSALKRRLRLLSAPTPSPPSTPRLSFDIPHPEQFYHQSHMDSTPPTSLPQTPIGEPIMSMSIRTDPNFLLMSPPTPPLDYHYEPTGITSLPPPPRRGSRRISTDRDKLLQGDGAISAPLSTPETSEDEPPSDDSASPREKMLISPVIQVHELSGSGLPLVEDILAPEGATASAIAFEVDALSSKRRSLDRCAVSLVDVSL